jgi:hypothetical protein
MANANQDRDNSGRFTESRGGANKSQNISGSSKEKNVDHKNQPNKDKKW